MATSTACYCGNAASTQRHPPATKLTCQYCTSQRLASIIDRYNTSIKVHASARAECHRRLSDTQRIRRSSSNDEDEDNDETVILPDPNQINERVSQLKHTLNELRSQSNELAVHLTAKTIENDDREAGMVTHSARVQLARERLDQMRACLLDDNVAGVEDSTKEEGKEGTTPPRGGGLRDALISGTKEIQTLRFQFACQVFNMHRLDVGEQYSTTTEDGGETAATTKVGNNEGATGVGKILGLPLPHAGPVLYGVIPAVVLASSLRLVASLTQLVARCLGVILPHPILVCFKECYKCGSMYDFGCDVVDVSSNYESGCDNDDSDDDEYLGGGGGGIEDTDHRENWCSACLNNIEGMSKDVPSTPTRPGPSLSQENNTRRSSILAIMGTSARKVATLTTTAISLTSSVTSRAITHMQQSTSTSTGTANSKNDCHQSKSNTSSSMNVINNDIPLYRKSYESVSMSPSSISRRIQHASFAYIRESHDISATEYILNPPRYGDDSSTVADSSNDDSNIVVLGGNTNTMTKFTNRDEFHEAEERFAIGLQLLQNDIVALCFRAGVDVSQLWPAESVLLNLHSLWRHCQQMAGA